MLKENFDADMKDMQRKLAEALANAKPAEDDSNKPVVDEKVLFQLKQITAERDAFKKQLLIAMGEEVESSSEYYSDEEEEEGEKEKPAEKKEKPSAGLVFGGKKLQELQKKVDSLELTNQKLQTELESVKANSADELRAVNTQLALARNECNRLRGINPNDPTVDDSGLDEKDKVIR